MRAQTKKSLTSAVATKTNGAKAKGAAPVKKTAPVAITAPPAWIFPKVPNGFEPPDGGVARRRSKPTEQMRIEAEDFAAEIRSRASYADDFGKRAPDPIALADLVDMATQWDAVYDAAAPIAAYAKAMRGAAWDAALKPVKKLKRAYLNAVTDEPSVAKTWRQTAAFFGAREEPALRGAETKDKAKKEKAKEAASAGASAPKS